jgi:hypothetical protein
MNWPTQGGSLRVYVRTPLRGHAGPEAAGAWTTSCRRGRGVPAHRETYQRLAQAAQPRKVELLSFPRRCAKGGRSVVGFGAAAKGNTLLNYAGVSADWIDYCVDSSPTSRACACRAAAFR